MTAHLIIMPVLLPALLALLLLLLPDRLALQRAIAAAGILGLLVLALVLLRAASLGPPQLYRLGDWPAPFGIVLVLDRLAGLMLLLTAGLAVPVLLYAIGSGWDGRGRHFHALLLFQTMGLNGAFLTGDAFNLFVFFELLLIASYGLMIHGGGAARLRAGVQYVAFNLLGSALFLIGLGTIYAVTGTLNMADLAVKLAALPAGDGGLLRVAAAMLFLVFAIKAALVPLQFWLPGTYARAPGPVAALFAVMTKVGAYALLRFGTLVFPAGQAAAGDLLPALLPPAALATVLLGAVGGLGAGGLARMISFAAIGSMGLLFLALSTGTAEGTAAGLYYLLHSTLATAGLFLLADLIGALRGTDSLTGMAPRPRGGVALLFLAAAVAMAGLPPLPGFLGKLLILRALGDAGPLVWAVILLAALASLLAFARTGVAIFWQPAPPAGPAPPLPVLAIGLVLAALAALTLTAGPVMAWLGDTAAALHAPAAYIAANALPGGS